MKMAYEYARVTQVFTLSLVPACWVYPVSLLLHAYCSSMDNTQIVITPNFPDEETLEANESKYYTELVPGREY